MRIGDDVLAVLSGLTVADGRVTMPPLDRKLYLHTNKVLEALGGTWNRKAQAHVFPQGVDVTDRIAAVVLTGEVRTDSDLGFFPTPPELARELVRRANVRSGMSVLEPSAGTGAIAMAARAVGGVVLCVELDEDRCDVLRRNGLPLAPHADFLRMPAPETDAGRFDRVVMNPPFAKQADIAHVQHAVRFLRPGGRLVAVMAAGVTFRQDKAAVAFRVLVADRNGAIEPLPDGTFKAAGTAVRTVVVEL